MSAPASDPVEMLAQDNARLREAGGERAAAALYVAKEYDGVHRLMLAVAGWAQAVAGEGGRALRHGPDARAAAGEAP